MVFTLKDENSREITNKLTSFWFYMPFEIDTNHRVKLLSGDVACRLAVMLDGDARMTLPPPSEHGNEGDNRLEIAHRDNGVLKFSNLSYEGSINLARRGEWAQLRLFRGAKPLPQADGASASQNPNWIESKQWARNPFPVKYDPNRWSRAFSFGEISDASIDQSIVEENEKGAIVAVSLIRRLVRNTICEEVLKNGALDDATSGEFMPQLQIRTKDPVDPKASTASKAVANNVARRPEIKLFTRKTESNAYGYVMICSGAFAAINADYMLSEWDDIPNAREAMKKLAKVLWAPDNVSQKGNDAPAGGRFLRKLHNTHDDGSSGIFAVQGLNTDPVEVLYVRGKDKDSDIM